LHYIHTWFFIDFIEAVPYFSLLQFLENNEKSINPISYILLIIKIIISLNNPYFLMELRIFYLTSRINYLLKI
jgi:hypothetical protein